MSAALGLVLGFAIASLFYLGAELRRRSRLSLRQWRAERDGIRRCRECGCTEVRACQGGCYWVDQDLCSACWEAA